MNLVRVTPPSVEPITLAQAKSWLRIDTDDEDADITDLIATARERAEAEISRSFLTTTWRLEEDAFPGMYVDPRRPGWTYERNSPGPLLAFFFPRATVQSVDSITYLATNGTVTTLDPSLYQFQAGDFARLAPVYGHTWPATRFEPGAVKVTFTAGYGDDATTVPACIKMALRVYLAHLYFNRGDSSSEIPKTVRDLLAAENWGDYG